MSGSSSLALSLHSQLRPCRPVPSPSIKTALTSPTKCSKLPHSVGWRVSGIKRLITTACKSCSPRGGNNNNLKSPHSAEFTPFPFPLNVPSSQPRLPPSRLPQSRLPHNRVFLNQPCPGRLIPVNTLVPHSHSAVCSVGLWMGGTQCGDQKAAVGLTPN